MFGMFKKKFKGAAKDIKKFEKKDLMEASVGIAVLVMWADGSAEDAEQQKVQAILKNTPALSNYGPEVQDTFNRFNSLCKEVGFIAARVQILREIEQVKHDRAEAEDVFVIGVTVANSDGELEEPEQKLLDTIGSMLGLRLADYLS